MPCSFERWGDDLKALLGSFLKIVLASLIMGLLAFYLYQGLGLIMNPKGFLNQIIILALVILAAVLVYFILIRWMGIQEINDVLSSAKKRFLKSQN